MYAKRDDLVARFSESEIGSLEQDDSGSQDEAVSKTAIDDACAEADSYIAVAYRLPLPNVETPPMLLQAVCDIARYRLYKNRSTEEVRKRYEDAVSWLKRVASGGAKLPFPTLSDEQTKAARNPASLPTGTTYVGGVFGSIMTDKML